MTEDRREKPGAESKVPGRLGGWRTGLQGLELDGWGPGGNRQREELMATEEAGQCRTHLRPDLLAQTVVCTVLPSGKTCEAGQAEL